MLGHEPVLLDPLRLFALGHILIASICEHVRLFSMHQRDGLRHVDDVGRCAQHAVHQAGLGINPDMRLHYEERVSPLLGLVHLGVTLTAAVLCRAGRGNDGGVHHGASLEQHTLMGQPGIDVGQHLRASWCFSSRWRMRRMVLSSDTRAAPSRPIKQRCKGQTCRSSSIAGSIRFHHSCRQWMRSMVSTAVDGRPPSAWCAPRACCWISATKACKGTTLFIFSRKTSLRVFLWKRSSPGVIWFMSLSSPHFTPSAGRKDLGFCRLPLDI